MVMKHRQLPRSTPESQGIRSSAVLDFVEAADRGIRHLHSFVLLRRGALIAEGYWSPYRPSDPHVLFSLSKSFTSTAVGMLVAEGRLTVEDPVLSHFPDEAPSAPSERLRQMRVNHLLTMNTGHHVDPTPLVRQGGPAWRRSFLALPVEHEPGTHFVYNSAATYMLSAIVQRLTGQRVVEFLESRLFEPLGIEAPTWEVSPEGIDAGGWGLSARTADIARFGQLYLQGGVWQGRQLVPRAWVDAATAFQVPNATSGNPNPDWQQGYGYQFWRCRHNAYRGDGAFGQYCIVMPEQDAVIIITSGVKDMQAVLDLVWKHLLPALGTERLPEDAAEAGRLADRLASLRMDPVAGQATSPRAAEISGRSFAVAPNDDGISSISFDFAADGATLTIRNDSGEQRVACGYSRWARGEADVESANRRHQGTQGPVPNAVVASGAWTAEDTYIAELWWYQTPFRRTLSCRFTGNGVLLEQRANLSFGSTARPTLEGQAIGVR
jgi:CubicO group peptidase (beta-lactamase class C family)